MPKESIAGLAGFVVGNGESRKGISLKGLQKIGPLYGCNALYRDFNPDILVALDKPMVQEIKESGYEGHLVWFPRDKKKVMFNDSVIFDAPRGAILTGTIAAWLMCKLNSEMKYIFLLGYDFPGEMRPANNLYKGTKNYKPENSQDNPRASYLEDFKRIVFEEFPKVRFYKVGEGLPPCWSELDNVVHLPMEEFKKNRKNLKVFYK